MGNKNLRLARKTKNDEFYTQLTTIENEIMHYREHFKGKVVYLNCDDPRESNFFHYFSYNFERLELKKLIASCYKNQDYNLFSKHDNDKAVWLEYNGEKDGGRVPTAEAIGIHKFEGDGDFRSEESIVLLKQADIVVTNPPFSLFREYVAQLMEYDKKFLLLGNINATTYKEIFPLIKDNKMWLGINNGPFIFELPEDTLSTSYYINEDGKKMQKFGNITWYTNLDYPKRHEDIILFRKYKENESNYPKYDNYDAINVDKIAEIPKDFSGVMGVPIGILSKYNPSQFEIVGLSRYVKTNGMSKEFVDKYYASGQKGSISEGHPDLCYYNADDKPIVPYMRVLIQNKTLNQVSNIFENAKLDLNLKFLNISNN